MHGPAGDEANGANLSGADLDGVTMHLPDRFFGSRVTRSDALDVMPVDLGADILMVCGGVHAMIAR